ncbi:MAG: MerR family transcriptional regulator, partial [Acidimicrobiia bacterium]
MELRVEQLAAAADVSVDTVRFYQARGLLPPPTRRGRVAWYGDDHLERLGRIRSLQARGLTLATIRRLLDGELDAADEALVAAVARPAGDEADEGLLSAEELSERTGIPVALLDAVAREGLLVPRPGGYTAADVDVAAAGLRLLEHGLPLTELLELARDHHRAVRAVAERAVELFDEHVR